jgi:hypothetical protein
MKKYLLVVAACAVALYAQIAPAQSVPDAQIESAASTATEENKRLAAILLTFDRMSERHAKSLELVLSKMPAGGVAVVQAPAPIQFAPNQPVGMWQTAVAIAGDVFGGIAKVANIAAGVYPAFEQRQIAKINAGLGVEQAKYNATTQAAMFTTIGNISASGNRAAETIATAGFNAGTSGNAAALTAMQALAARPSSVTTITATGSNVASDGSIITANRNCTGGTTGNGGNGGTTGATTPPTTIGNTNTPPTTTGGAGGSTGSANGGTC